MADITKRATQSWEDACSSVSWGSVLPYRKQSWKRYFPGDRNYKRYAGLFLMFACTKVHAMNLNILNILFLISALNVLTRYILALSVFHLKMFFNLFI